MEARHAPHYKQIWFYDKLFDRLTVRPFHGWKNSIKQHRTFLIQLLTPQLPMYLFHDTNITHIPDIFQLCMEQIPKFCLQLWAIDLSQSGRNEALSSADLLFSTKQ